MHKKNLPLLVIFFNRPNVFRRQLRALKQFKPTSIYFSADGPRVSNEKDLQKLNLCKQMIATEIDWACNLHFNYSEKNYGCDQFVPKAIDWFFSNEEAGIVLEDDCLISKDFYTFSSILLDKYAADDRVMSISASNFQSKEWGEGDYYFSRYPANWAWATWRRAWQHFDFSMQDLDQFTAPDGGFNRIKLSSEERRYWLRFFCGLQSGKYTFWDAKWLYSIWKRNGIAITPNFNLSTNIGYGESATHTKDRTQTHAIPIDPLRDALKDPPSLEIQTAADHYLYLNFYKPSLSGLFKSVMVKMKKLFL
jgi:hypothetical protein